MGAFNQRTTAPGSPRSRRHAESFKRSTTFSTQEASGLGETKLQSCAVTDRRMSKIAAAARAHDCAAPGVAGFGRRGERAITLPEKVLRPSPEPRPRCDQG